jgi:hypothetical protein
MKNIVKYSSYEHKAITDSAFDNIFLFFSIIINCIHGSFHVTIILRQQYYKFVFVLINSKLFHFGYLQFVFFLQINPSSFLLYALTRIRVSTKCSFLLSFLVEQLLDLLYISEIEVSYYEWEGIGDFFLLWFNYKHCDGVAMVEG